MKQLLIFILFLNFNLGTLFAQFEIPHPIVDTAEFTITDTIFMSPDGSDDYPGTMELPVKTFSHAIELLPWGSHDVNNGHSYGLIMLLPGFYETSAGFRQTAGQWEKDGLYKNVSVEGIGEVIIGGTRENFAENHLLQLRGDHIYIRNLKLQYTTGSGMLLNRTPRGQNNVLIENVELDSVGIFSILMVGVDTILVRNAVSRYASRPGNDSLTTPCQWSGGIKFLDCRYATIHDSEVAFTRGEGLNFHNSKYGQAFNNVLRDNPLNFYNDNSSHLQIFNNLIYNHPDTDPVYWRTCPADTGDVWSGRGILIANEGACTDGFWPVFENCETRCVGAPRSYPNVDSMFFYNNIMLNTGRAISFWEGVTDIIGHNCIRNVFIFNNTIVGAMGMPDAGLSGFINLFFPTYNVLNNGNHARLQNVRIFNNIFSYDTGLYDNLRPYRENFHPLHPTPDAVDFSNNLWIKEPLIMGMGDEIRTEMPGFIHPEVDFEEVLLPCKKNPYWIKEAENLLAFLQFDYLGSPRGLEFTNVGAIEYRESCFSVTVTEQLGREDIKLFPNPARNWIQIITPNKEGDHFYSILDLSGRVLRKGEVSDGMKKIDVYDLHPGFYLLRISGKPSFYATFVKY